ncbi:MAG: flagellar FliJ family protein [Phycisphaerales bacterium]|nr:flagellar FliJ family protein [Phycisphaerales bacterium]
MAKFVFQFEAVLKQRRAVERARQLAVASIERERLALQDTISAMQRQIVREKNDLREQLLAAREGAHVDLRSVRLQAGASLDAVAKTQRAVLQLAGVHSRLDAARLQLLDAATKRKSVEMLKERRFEEWKAEQAALEGRMLDELSVMRAARKEEPDVGGDS